ncbi:hypothetical protein [Frankia sp. AvcI1]|uniref:DUF7676 family protein n=1 Tax=Frankia sp. AvcI1 TaxID=573496 RepID=UPI0006EC0B09|nr:hypothetical protein [Frankia sp. AvcI1]
MTSPAAYRTVEEFGTGTLHVFALPIDERTLLDIIGYLFTEQWAHISFGVLVQGAAWEITIAEPARRISTYDGYATVDLGRWHFHLCVGEHTASGPELGRARRCARAELYRRVDAAGTPMSWAFRMVNGIGEQMMTVFLPNPFLGDDQHPLRPPDFGRLAAWDHLRAVHLGLPPDPLDRAGTGFHHG